jgi:hypothetical protein
MSRLMDNLTLAEGVIKPHVVGPLEGYSVVVLERTPKGGEVLRYVLMSGQEPAKRAFRFTDLFRARPQDKEFIAYAVTANLDLRTSLTFEVTSANQTHSFDVTVHIEFRVSSPELVVARRMDDPVRRIRRAAEIAAAREFARCAWSDLRHRFADVERAIVNITLDTLRAHAVNYGLWVENCLFNLRAGEEDQRAIPEEVELERHAKRQHAGLSREIELWPLRETLKARERLDVLTDAATEAVARAIMHTGGTITTATELAQAMELLQRAQSQLSVRDQRLSLPTSIAPPSDGGEQSEVNLPGMEVAFRAVWPARIHAGETAYGHLRVYAYVGREGAAAVAHDLRHSVRGPEAMSGSATTRQVQIGARMRVVPSAPGIHFHPASITLPELTSWLRADFEMRVHDLPRKTDEPVAGVIQFFTGPLLVGQLSFSVNIIAGDHSSPRSRDDVEVREAQGMPHRRIFVSYSRRDMAVVTQLERLYKVLGHSSFRDIDVLHSGEDWRHSLLGWIGEADVFQLCWSRAAKASRNVEEEWRYALALDRTNFIRPVYWQTPLPLPPPELARLHFAFYEMPRLSMKRWQRDGRAR